MNVNEFLDEVNRFSFWDDRMTISACLVPGHASVRVTLTARIFPDVGPDGKPGLGRSVMDEIFSADAIADQHNTTEWIPEYVIRPLWDALVRHEFEELLRRDGQPVFYPHGDPVRSELAEQATES